jgi:hypothetical protein
LFSVVSAAALCVLVLSPSVVNATDPAWRGEYYPNRWLAGAPIVVRDDPNINFDWGAGSPHPYLPPDGFSARWTRVVFFEGGRYRFTAQSDDGIRLFVDGALIIDEWQDQAGATFSVERDLRTGDHSLRVEYYENVGGAMARVSWSRVDAPPPPAAWRGEYWSNPWLSGAPTLVRDDPEVNFNWGYGSPSPALPPDRFSVRWTRSSNFDGGRYRFTVVTDDGARLFVDGKLIIDAWKVQAAATYQVEVDLPAGSRAIRMEYFEDAGEATARLSWERIGGGPAPSGGWRGEYYPNRSLSGTPVVVRTDEAIDFDWGSGSPDSRIPPDNFSVRWTRSVELGGGKYRFTTTTDDGVRLYIDGRLMINQWKDMGKVSFSTEVDLRAGMHTLRMEYYEHTGAAFARLTWDKAPATRAIGNIITCARPHNSYVKVYRAESGRWLDTNPRGYSPISANGYLKLDGMVVDTTTYGNQGHPYRVELWADGRLIRSVGNTANGEPAFRVRAFADNYTPWGCPAP